MAKIKLFTIGFTQKSAQSFFTKLKNVGVVKLIDIRLNNISQLAGFAKRDDLIYFLQKICDCSYEHLPNWAPTKDILEAYKKKQIDWNEYEKRFSKLINERKIESLIKSDDLNNSCLLCSEPSPDKCHRRLIAEYLKEKFVNIEIIHL